MYRPSTPSAAQVSRVQQISGTCGVELTAEELTGLHRVFLGVGVERFERALRAYSKAFAANGRLRFLNLDLFLSLTVEFRANPVAGCTYATAAQVRDRLLSLRPQA